MTEKKIDEGATFTAGSGSNHFWELLYNESHLKIQFEELFIKAVKTNPDPATGGAIQIVTVKRDAAEV
ncbi:hypothetical protein K3718_00625 [Leisingera aquaemixtae]|uniref:Uncharacterized protein n=1 Tax=Leisingera aquaemixtae TaxID=1396826 RepID=A0ABY5WJI5_9RHOB|nr:hypothetical protein [Leisingera aquaemixtae]UWQ41623.1 hypothetical protein K3718_00625 [Leisingera aquaemixtae]